MSAKSNQRAQPKTSAAMEIGGAIRLIVKPELLAELAAGKEVSIDFGRPGTNDWFELGLQIKAGPENSIQELTPWFNLDHSLLKIENSVVKDGPEYVQDYFSIYFEESENRCVGLAINGKQARALADMLLAYCRVREAIEALEATPQVA